MAWSWAFLIFLLAFGVNAEDLCASARKSATQASSFCDPKRINAYIECKDGRDVVSTCPDGLSWSLKIQACVDRMLSECAAGFERKTKKAPAVLCDTQPALTTGCTLSYRCHPEDASHFVICPPNTVYAHIGRCPENRLFSLNDSKCLAERKTDCARALEVGPEAANIESASAGTPVNPTTANVTTNAANIMSDANLKAANMTVGNITTTGLGSSNLTKSANTSAVSTDEAASMRVVPNGPGIVPNGPSAGNGLTPNGPTLPKKPSAVCRARYSFHPEKADWEGARQICEMEGGQLAVITDERSQGRIGSRFGKLDEFWIGATDIEREGQFRWVNGQGLTFARWYSSQPNKYYPNNEHCVTFNYWGKDTKWGDRNCFDSRPFLCETMICRPNRRRFPGGYPNQFRGPLRNPYRFPQNQNFPGPRGYRGIAVNTLPRGRGFPYDRFERIRTPISG